MENTYGCANLIGAKGYTMGSDGVVRNADGLRVCDTMDKGRVDVYIDAAKNGISNSVDQVTSSSKGFFSNIVSKVNDFMHQGQGVNAHTTNMYATIIVFAVALAIVMAIVMFFRLRRNNTRIALEQSLHDQRHFDHVSTVHKNMADTERNLYLMDQKIVQNDMAHADFEANLAALHEEIAALEAQMPKENRRPPYKRRSDKRN